MKKNNNFKMSVFIFATFLFVGCTKESPTTTPPNNGGGGATKTLPTTPTTLTLVATQDSILYDSSTTIKVTTDGQTVTTGTITVTGGSITFSGLKNDTTIIFNATNSNENGTSVAKITSIVIHVFSKKASDWQNLGTTHNTMSRYCIAGTENSVNTIWNPGVIDCNYYWIHANETSTGSIGQCNPNPGTATSGWWSWTDASQESVMFSGLASETYKITILSNGWKRSKVVNGFYMEQTFTQ